MREGRIPEAVLAEICDRPKGNRIPGAAWAVLIALYVHADDDGVCWPSVTRIATLTGADRSTVIRAVGWLEDNGVITRQRTPGKANLYRLPTRRSLATSGGHATSGEGELVASPHRTSGIPATKLVASPPPKLLKEQPLNTASPAPRAAEERGAGEAHPVRDGSLDVCPSCFARGLSFAVVYEDGSARCPNCPWKETHEQEA